MNWKKWIPLAVIIVAMAIFYFSGAYKYFSFDSIKTHRQSIQAHISAHPVLTPMIFIAIYILAVALSFPGATFFTLFGGFFFGLISTLYTTIGAAIGAALIFLAARTALGDTLKKKAGPFLSKMKAGFERNAASYLLFLRFIPLFPFWLVNLAPAFFGVSLVTFFWTTCVGILPGSFVYTQAGHALGAIFDQGESFSLDTVFNTQMKIALIVLACFSLVPIVVKKLIKKFKKNHD
ncbi:MAG: VTT domain-containing protein [Chlamydiota bacterium]